MSIQYELPPESDARNEKDYDYFRSQVLDAIMAAHQQGHGSEGIRIPDETYLGGSVTGFLYNEGIRRGPLTDDEYRGLVDLYNEQQKLLAKLGSSANALSAPAGEDKDLTQRWDNTTGEFR